MVKKIGFVTDTNIIESKHENNSSCSPFIHTAFFTDYLKDLENTKWGSKVTYFMPDIILKELMQQQREVMHTKYTKLKTQYEELLPVLNGALPEESIETYLTNEQNKCWESFRVLTLAPTANLMDELIAEALGKVAPFDKSACGGKTDAGFKDALIWKTLLYSKEIDEYDELYFFSGDKVFQCDELFSQFHNMHANTQLKVPNIDPKSNNKRQDALEHIINDHNLPKTSTVQLYNAEFILAKIRTLPLSIEELSGGTVSICFESFATNDFYIESIKEQDDRLFIEISFLTRNFEIKKCAKNIEPEAVSGKIELQAKIIDNRVRWEDEYRLYDIRIKHLLTLEKLLSNLTVPDSLFPMQQISLQLSNTVLQAQIDALKEYIESIPHISLLNDSLGNANEKKDNKSKNRVVEKDCYEPTASSKNSKRFNT